MLLRFIDIVLLREWSVQSLLADQTKLVLVSGKRILQNTIFSCKALKEIFQILIKKNIRDVFRLKIYSNEPQKYSIVCRSNNTKPSKA